MASQTLSPSIDSIRRWLALTALASLLMGSAACGWSYAADKVGPERVDTGERQVKVIEPEPDPKIEAAKAAARANQDPCKVGSFTVFKLTDSKHMSRKIDCKSGRIVHQANKAVDKAEVRSMMADSIPTDSWYLLVDPIEPPRSLPDTVSNAQLIGLNKRFALRFHQKMAQGGLIIYRFEEVAFAP